MQQEQVHLLVDLPVDEPAHRHVEAEQERGADRRDSPHQQRL
jgi:hypothetical protein